MSKGLLYFRTQCSYSAPVRCDIGGFKWGMPTGQSCRICAESHSLLCVFLGLQIHSQSVLAVGAKTHSNCKIHGKRQAHFFCGC